MKFTKDWLSDHLHTNKSEQQIVEKLNGIGLEVEKVEHIKNDLSNFILINKKDVCRKIRLIRFWNVSSK